MIFCNPQSWFHIKSFFFKSIPEKSLCLFFSFFVIAYPVYAEIFDASTVNTNLPIESSFETILKLDRDKFQNHIGRLLVAKQFTQLEHIAREIKTHPAFPVSGAMVFEAFLRGLLNGDGTVSITVQKESYLEIFNEWLRQNPNSIAAHIAMISAFDNLAYQHRGTDYAYTVTEEGQRMYTAYESKAWVMIEKAMALPEKDANLYALAISIANDLGEDKKKLKKLAETGLDIDPYCYPIYLRMAVVLLYRWQGEPGDLEKFAQWATEKTGNDEIYARIANRARSMEDAKLLTSYKLSRDKIQSGFLRLKQEFPESYFLLHSFAWFSTSFEDRTTSKELFEKIGGEWDTDAQQIWGSREAFLKSRLWALGNH